MSLKRSFKSKSRSLNLRQRDDDSLKEDSTELIMKESNFEGKLLYCVKQLSIRLRNSKMGW